MRLRPVGSKKGKKGASIDLSGSWKYRPGATLRESEEWPRAHWLHNSVPTALFNGMVSPVVP